MNQSPVLALTLDLLRTWQEFSGVGCWQRAAACRNLRTADGEDMEFMYRVFVVELFYKSLVTLLVGT